MKKSVKTRRGPSRRPAVTLARAISKHGVASRTEAGRLIEKGEVSVNGFPEGNPRRWVDPARDAITIGGKSLPRAAKVYLAMHKPPGIVTTRQDERGRPTVYDILPGGLPWVFPVGRLDRDSTGLLLLTNDTQFGERVTGPGEKVPKTYRVELARPLSERDASRVREGLVLPGNIRCRPAEVVFDDQPGVHCRVVITEGKNRQIRRMFEALGNRVVRLHRVAIGSVELGGLKEGEVRSLTPEEIASLGGRAAGAAERWRK